VVRLYLVTPFGTKKMQIKDILQEKGNSVITIGAGDSIHAAIVELNNHGFGALIVTGDNGQIAGIITERDILQCCGDTCTKMQTTPTPDHAICNLRVQDIMTKDLVIGVPDDDLNYVMGIMTKHQIRHLPILDNGKLEGIIAIGDLVKMHFEENVFESRTLKDYFRGWEHTL
jgi:CBS domain-containing protein